MTRDLALKAAVIGGGNIGALQDLDVQSALPLTHAGAFNYHPNFELVGICDPRPNPRINKWKCATFNSINDLFKQQKPDVVSVAVPANEQFDVLMRLKDEPNVQAVISEKPLSDNLKQAQAIVDAFRKTNKKLIVNFSRRYSQMFAELSAKFMRDSEKVISASIRYSKGLKNNGSHALDLAVLLFGEISEVKVLSSTIDFDPKDPTFSVYMRFQYCPEFYLQSLNEHHFTLFEIDIFTETSRYLITNDHREKWVFCVENNAGIPRGRRLVFQQIDKTDYECCLVNLLNDVFEVVTKNKEPICSGQKAVDVHRLIDKIKID